MEGGKQMGQSDTPARKNYFIPPVKKVEKVRPKRVILRGGVREIVTGMQDGKVDFQGEGQAVAGVFTRTLKVDPPGALIFECVCGHKRRVLHSEKTFRCERGGWPKPDCDILWTRRQKMSNEFDEETGQPLWEDETEEVELEVIEEFTGKRKKAMVPCPIFEGRKLSEVKREEYARRRSLGLVESDQPQNADAFGVHDGPVAKPAAAPAPESQE